MMQFFRSLTPTSWYILAGILFAFLLGLGWFVSSLNEMEERAEEAGVTKAVTQGHRTTLDQLKEANDAEAAMRDERHAARYADCLRNSRIRESCERYRPAAD